MAHPHYINMMELSRELKSGETYDNIPNANMYVPVEEQERFKEILQNRLMDDEWINQYICNYDL